MGRIPTFHANILPLSLCRNASRLSGIHEGLRRTERARPDEFSKKREIRQKREDEPYLTPEERQRARALARRNPLDYKIRKGKKDITEEPGPPRKSKSARFNDPRDPFGSRSVVKQLKSGKIFQKFREKMSDRDAVMTPEAFEMQLKLDQAENLLGGSGGAARGQHEAPNKFAKRAERQTSKWPSKDAHTPNNGSESVSRSRFQPRDGARDERRSSTPYQNRDDNSSQFGRSSRGYDKFESAPRSRFQPRDGARDERRSPTPYQNRDDNSRHFGRSSQNNDETMFDLNDRHDRRGFNKSGSRYDNGYFNKSSDEPSRERSFGSRSDRFEPLGRSREFVEAKSSLFQDRPRDRERRSTYEQEETTEFTEVNEGTVNDDVDIRRIKVWEPPVVVPFTTAASQFLYGTSTVEAAIEGDRRKIYKLYIYQGKDRRNRDRDDSIAKMAQRRGIPVEYLGEQDLGLMNKMASSRVHNGYVLEASPLPQIPVTALGEVPADASQPGFKISLGHQSREETTVNGTPDFIITEPSSRKPFVLLLDQILDPGNLGAVIRTASFMGVTAIVTTKRGSAPVTPIVLKASAGAAETMTLLSTDSVVDFVEASKENGWKVYAAVPPKVQGGVRQVSTFDVEASDPLLQDPCLLVLGNEGEGLSRQLKKSADMEVSIPNMGGSKVVDSLNVSVAAGMLFQAFLRGKTMSAEGFSSSDVKDNVLF